MQVGAGVVGLHMSKDSNSLEGSYRVLGDPLGTWRKKQSGEHWGVCCLGATLWCSQLRELGKAQENTGICLCTLSLGSFAPAKGSSLQRIPRGDAHRVAHGEDGQPTQGSTREVKTSSGGITKGHEASPTSSVLAAFPCRARPHQVKAGRHQAAQQGGGE